MKEVPKDQYGDPEWDKQQIVNHYRAFAFELAHRFTDAEGGLMLDLPRAAQWLRVAGDFEYNFLPYRDYAELGKYDRGSSGDHLARILFEHGDTLAATRALEQGFGGKGPERDRPHPAHAPAY